VNSMRGVCVLSRLKTRDSRAVCTRLVPPTGSGVQQKRTQDATADLPVINATFTTV
jgi:hypothetical protein